MRGDNSATRGWQASQQGLTRPRGRRRHAAGRCHGGRAQRGRPPDANVMLAKIVPSGISGSLAVITRCGDRDRRCRRGATRCSRRDQQLLVRDSRNRQPRRSEVPPDRHIRVGAPRCSRVTTSRKNRAKKSSARWESGRRVSKKKNAGANREMARDLAKSARPMRSKACLSASSH